jgi:DNA-binding NarL/FixJ family response regulator
MPKVFEYDSGEEAVAAYEVQRPDYVLMDIELKHMNGFETMREIYALDPIAKIIMVTSYDTSAFKAKAKQMRVKGFISKDSLSEITPLLDSLAQSA